MLTTLLGKKIGMTQVYDDAGVLRPVTVIEVGPCVVLQVKTKDKDQYDAVQIGFGEKSRRHANNAERVTPRRPVLNLSVTFAKFA